MGEFCRTSPIFRRRALLVGCSKGDLMEPNRIAEITVATLTAVAWKIAGAFAL